MSGQAPTTTAEAGTTRKAPAQGVETGVSRNASTSLEMGGSAVTTPDEAFSAEVGGPTPSRTAKASEERDQKTVADPDGDEDAGDATSDDTASDEGDAPAADLGDYDPAAPEAFDAAYFTADGELNAERLGSEFWGNAAKGVDGLNEATYDYLKDRLGLSKEYVKSIEAGQKALREAGEATLYAQAGGKERLDAAIAWGKDGGYTEAQRARFTAAMQSGDKDAQAEAIDALMARYERTTGDQPKRTPGRPGRRPSTPARSATAGAAAQGGPAGYASYEDYQREFRPARKANDAAKLAEIRRKLRASSWHSKEG